jgi:putative flippase GtrA
VIKIDHKKLLRFMLAGGPAFVLAIPLNYLLVHELGWDKSAAYAVVLAMQMTVNFFVCRWFVFDAKPSLSLWKSFVVFINGIALLRLADWLVYVLLTKKFELPYLSVQLLNVLLFAVLKFEFAKRVFERKKK